MPDGELRRPPRLEGQQLLARIQASTALGALGSSVASVVPPEPTPTPDGTGSDQAPPFYADLTTTTPTGPNVAQVIAGLAITWSATDTAGNPYPAGVFAEIHISSTTGFTPDASTLKGTLSRAGTFTVTGLTAGTGYYVRLVIVDEAGQRVTSSQVGPTTAGFVTTTAIGVGTITEDLVSFDATAIGGIQQYVGTGTPPTTGATGSTWVNTGDGSYNVLQLVSGVKTWVKQQWAGGGIAADSISTLQLAAGAVTAENILAQAITTKLVNGEVIRTSTDDTGARVRLTAVDGIEVYSSTERVFHAKPDGTVTVKGAITSGSTITGATLTGSKFQTRGSGARLEISNDASFSDALVWYNSSNGVVAVIQQLFDYLYVNAPLIGGARFEAASFSTSGNMSSGSLTVSGANVDMQGVYDNNTTGLAPVGITTTGRLRRNGTSSQTIKYDIATLSGGLSASVDEARQCDVATSDPAAILDVGVVEFSVIDEGLPTERRLLGFIADDVADKLPIAVLRDAEGAPAGVIDQAMVAALLSVVQQQQQTIADLTTRIEALEA
jgi:hypothetical protein